jgi:hypothetical protein
MVVIPLMEEFRDRPLLLSAPTLERGVQRLVAAGELPLPACLRCGDGAANGVEVVLECERARARAGGGRRFLIVPGLFWMTWREEEWVEIRGRDTVVRTPVALCAECRGQLRGQATPGHLKSLLLTILLLAVSGLVGYFHLVAGVALAVVGLVVLGWLGPRVFRRRQQALKALLRRVPVYHQVLERYPWAVVNVSEAAPDEWGSG